MGYMFYVMYEFLLKDRTGQTQQWGEQAVATAVITSAITQRHEVTERNPPPDTLRSNSTQEKGARSSRIASN